MYVLGINAAFHDSSAALLRDGVPVAAAEEERFTRIKHGKRPVPFLSYQLPFHAIDYCLRAAGIEMRRVDHVAYSFDPTLCLGDADPEKITLPLYPSAEPRADGRHPWEPLFLAGILNAPRFLTDDVPHHLAALRHGMDRDAMPPFEFVEHHLAHAASTYYVSGFGDAAILTIDGRGEQATTLFARGSGPNIEKLGEVRLPHSLGILYETVTSYLGFLHSSDEYKVMALTSVRSDRYLRDFRSILSLDGLGYRVEAPDLEERFGPARKPWEPLEERHFAVAFALQTTLEETVLELARGLHERTGDTRLCMAGGVALNCVMNARLRDEGPFDQIFVQPAAGDAGTALGAAYVVDARERGIATPFTMKHAYLGPEYDEEEIEGVLSRARLAFERPADIAEATADLLARDRIVGWFQGRMEFGPRALGSRSIVASPADSDMKDRLNAIKQREEFRPVAPAVLEERAAEYFSPARPDPFMLFVENVRPEKAHLIPAVRHIDGTARIQTVSVTESPLFHRLICAFEARSRVPVVVNTSFNTRGEPIVCTPDDALASYFTTSLDALAIGPFLLRKR